MGHIWLEVLPVKGDGGYNSCHLYTTICAPHVFIPIQLPFQLRGQLGGGNTDVAQLVVFTTSQLQV